ncbi:MAG: pyridoxamine 5'-phosphate oxidase [Ignavibacteria bacterium]|nr:pyridoxamine 5'-phosphate oxidase [Ignavibacteria bacterium]
MLDNRHKIIVSNLRKNYSLFELNENELPNNPISLFEKWFNQAVESEVDEPNAMTLATCSKDGKPSARIVLLKEFSSDGFIFFTNYESRKGIEIISNPNVALVFLWKELERQIRIVGFSEKTSREESEKYFYSRPIESQIGAYISTQSSVLTSKEELFKKFEGIKKQCKNNKIPFPENWGGFRVVPNEMEFWQGQPNRLHDRIVYSRNKNDWSTKRLYP